MGAPVTAPNEFPDTAGAPREDLIVPPTSRHQNNNSGKSTAAGGGKKDKQGFGGSRGGSFK